MTDLTQNKTGPRTQRSYSHKQLRLAYLCLQATREGQASDAHVHEIIKGLQARGWECRLFEPWYANRTKAASLFEKMWAFVWVQLKFGVSVARYDVAYVRDHPVALLAIVFARLMRIPVVLEVNSPYDELVVSYPWAQKALPLLAWSFKTRSRLSTAVVTVTSRLCDWIEGQVPGVRVEFISNGADVDYFSPVEWDSVPRDYAVFIGVLAPWQGVDVLLKAATSEAWPKNLMLVIAGDGMLHETVTDAAMSSAHIEYLGRVQYNEVSALLSRGLTGLVPKHAEGRDHTGLAPLKLFESMASGVPVVVTDIPDQSDIVRDAGCGIVVAADDSEAICAALRWLDGNREQARMMGERGRHAAISEHSWDLKAAETDSLLREIIGSKDS